LWKAALQQWKLKPLTGTGSGTYLFYGRQFRADRIDYDPVEAHNDYLHLLAEYGIVGAFGFLIFFGTHLYCGWKNFLRLGPKRLAVSTRLFSNSLALQMGALAAIAAYLVHSALDFNLHIPANALLLALVFGLLANAGARREAEPALPAMSLLWWRLALPVIGAGILIQSARLLPGEYFAEQSRTSLRDQQRAASVYYALRGLASEKTNPNLFYYLGCGLVAEGNSTGDLDRRFSLFQGAILAFESARTLVPQDRTYPIALGSIYDALERFPEAEWMYDEALRLDPKDPDLQRNYQTHLDRWRKAGTDFERAANAVAPST
jgi:tetratricopeptide (TPR) repeat protein